MLELHHLCLGGSIAPWVDAVPLKPVETLDLGGEAWTLARGPNLYLAGQPQPAMVGRRPVNAAGIAHLCVQARAGDQLVSALEQADATFLSPPTALGTGFRYAYGHDASGRLFEVETAPFLPDSPAAWFGHVALVSPDAERLAGYYAAFLGGELIAGGRFRDNHRIDTVAGLKGVEVAVWWVRAGGFALEFWRYDAPPAPVVESAHWYAHIGIETDDLDAALRCRECSARSEGRDGRQAMLRDPAGNAMVLIELAAAAHDRGVSALSGRDVLARVAAARAAS